MKKLTGAGLTLLIGVAAAQVEAASHFKAMFIDQYDGNGDGKLSSVEFEQARRDRFDRTDVDHSGTVDPDEYLLEWENRMDAQLKRDRTSELGRVDRRFKALDADGDKRISSEEFEVSGERAFAQLDLNSDGVVDASDAEQAKAEEKARDEHKPLTRKEALDKVRPLLHLPSTHSQWGAQALYDEDGDDRVTREEFSRERQAQFARTDGNGDGGIDAKEYRREFEDRLEAAIESHRKGQVKQTGVRFDALDRDDDGIMTFGEYQRSGHGSFKRWDTDHDGYVTWDEAAPLPRVDDAADDDKADSDKADAGKDAGAASKRNQAKT
ncbi:MAG: EF-hand domain-containing protein [Parahaliea sp.]